MSEVFTIISAVLAVALLVVVVPVAVDAYRRTRGQRTVTCPETSRAATIAVDPAQAALTAVTGHMRLEVRQCSLWPARGGCAQGCVAQATHAASG